MQRNDDVLEKDDVLISKGDSESTDNTRQNVEELSCTVELVVLVDQCEETFVDSLTDHLSSWDELGIQFVQNVLKVVSFDRLL